MKSSYNVVVIGGGTGGVMTAAQIRRKIPNLSVAIIEPSKDHWYQPAWTLVGAGTFKMGATRKDESKLIPPGVDWIRDRVSTFDPLNNKVNTENSGAIQYDYLVVSPGMQMDIEALPGLREALATDYVCSNYIDPQKTYEVLKNFRGGNAVFTQPAGAIKCGGAPQKIMYLAEHYFRKHNLREKTRVMFATPGSVIFGVAPFSDRLNQILKERDIKFRGFHNPVKIDPQKKIIYFKYTKPDTAPDKSLEDPTLQSRVTEDGLIAIPYDMLHLAPPQSAPDFIKNSPLSYKEGPNKGFLNVNIHTLQHNEFANIFGIGDSAALPTAKTGAAIRKQSPVVVEGIKKLIAKQPLGETQYSGYSSCPIVTGYGEMLLAEFKYDNVRDSDPILSKFVDTSTEKYSMWILKKYGLPFLYWNMMMKGRM
jgi:sulfide:quinone oxidoreductase